MAKTKKPAPKKGGAAKPAPAKKPMRRKSKRALNSALPHVDVTAPKRSVAELRKAASKRIREYEGNVMFEAMLGMTSAELAAGVMSTMDIAAHKPNIWHRFRSAITGLFVPKAVADANPATTVREKVRK